MFNVMVKKEKNAEVRLEKCMWHYPILLLATPFFMVFTVLAGTVAIMYPISLLLGWV